MTHTPIKANFDDIAANSVEDVPEGFRPIKVGGAFVFHNGPLHGISWGQSWLAARSCGLSRKY